MPAWPLALATGEGSTEMTRSITVNQDSVMLPDGNLYKNGEELARDVAAAKAKKG